ncbi:amidohydrolase [Actinomadura rubrisoli]|uniref:Amidohydrolase n=1 Tax=Actinomadura rubrisoli TaxID=2530368 RepID=A0A4R5B7W5_9ACTN|nr:amidohydrolase [Actinomadura rubrisoli]TDD79764.1 amidohydrolase [Actinomadura rubrisoli]
MTPEMNRRQVLRGAAAVTAGTAATGMLSTGAAHAEGGGHGDADLVIHNGRVLVLDKHFRKAEAVAIRDGRVLAVGSARDMRRYTGRKTELLDAGGGTVLPGINDSHLHLNSHGLGVPPFNINVDTATIEQLVAAVRTAVDAAQAPDSWIRGRGWQELRLPRPPVAADLDPVSGGHPVILNDFSGHATAVNSVVLRRAGITRDTVPPPGGVIDKDANGEPTGVLRETAQGLVRRVVPPFTRDERSRAIDAAVKLLHSAGITSATEPGIDLDTLALYAEKARAGALPLRVTALLGSGTGPRSLRAVLDDYRPLSDVDPRTLRVAGVKVFADGIPRFRTAWMNKPYLNGGNGSLTIDGASPAEQLANLHEMIKISAGAGLQVGTHSCGDATTDAVVAGYVKADGHDRHRADLRHYVIHCNFPSARTLRTMARHDIGANLNAEILYLQGRVLEPIIGRELTEYQWPYRSAFRAGVHVTSGSDAPVVEPRWLRGVMTAVLREGADGGVAGTAERIALPEALATYTRIAAWQDHAERWKGTLEPGKIADICVVGGDVLGRDPHGLRDLQVTATVVGGRVVYERPKGARTAPAAATMIGSGESGHTCQDGKCCCELAEEMRG